jgi:hypothetical protein
MNNIENCLQNKIATSNNKLQPTIYKAILNLYRKGFLQITARMVKEECIKIDINIDWNNRLKAICNSMERIIECGVRIISENRPHNDFTISFDDNGNNLEISTPKKTSPNAETNKKEKTNSSSISPDNNVIELEKLNLSKNFKVVMVCAGGKKDSFFTAYPDENFVNNAVQNFEHHPDEIMNNGITSWRDYLMNNQNDTNIKKAYELYKSTKTKYPNIYLDLYHKYNTNFFILSAGWGLVNSEYRLPKYNITFSNGPNILPKNRRKKKSIYKDFNQFYKESKNLLINPEEDIVFIGGKDYLELFYVLTQDLPNRKIIYYKGNFPTNQPLNCQNFIFRNYLHSKPTTNTNWHYELAYKISNSIIP